MKQYIKSAAWLLAGALAMLLAGWIGSRLAPAEWARPAFWLSLAALTGGYALSVAKIVRDGREDVPDVEAEREKAVRRQAELEQDSSIEQAKIERLGKKIWAAWAGVTALCVMAAIFGGMGYSGSAVLGGALLAIGLVVLAPMLAFGLASPKMLMPAPGTELRGADYPELYALARETAAECGHERRIRIFLGEQGIGVFRADQFDGMLLPSILTGFLTKNELRQVMRHELSHLTCEDTKNETRWLTLIARMDAVMDQCAFCVFGMIVLFPLMEEFRRCATEYRTLIERKLEAEADDRKLSCEDARAAVAAIAKAAMFVRFCEEDRVSAYRCFESEEPRHDQVNIRAQVFEEMLRRRGKLWLQELESEQPAQFDSHPTFAQRREIYGVTDYDAFSQESDGAWLAEMKRMRGQENAYLAGNPDYAQMREHQYVKRRAAMEAYENCADPLNEMEPRAIVDAAEAYFGLNTPKAMEIVRALLNKDPLNLEPKLLLGVWLLDERDDAGLELLYQTAENGNYTHRALQEAGDYVFRRGCAEQIAEYRRRAAALLQYAAELHYRLDEISMSELHERTLPDALLKELTAEMVRLGEGSIRTIACAAKDFQPGEDAHVFVIEYADADDEIRGSTGAKIFELLDRREEHYAMRDDDSFPIRKLERQIPGCVVYTKDEN